ncbi:MAG: D-ribose pyranase [Chloroflexota bacterium]
MKKTGLLNQPLSTVIAGLGHTDMLCIGDAGLPIPRGPERIDLAVKAGVPAFLDVLDAVLGEMEVEQIIIAAELEQVSPEMHTAIMEKLSGTSVSVISHEAFKTKTQDAVAVVRTGEVTPYANIILVSGVVF